MSNRQAITDALKPLAGGNPSGALVRVVDALVEIVEDVRDMAYEDGLSDGKMEADAAYDDGYNDGLQDGGD